MSKVRRSANLLKMHNKRAANVQSLGQFADAVKSEIPTGKEVVQIEGMVTGWAEKAEAIEKKVSPAVQKKHQEVGKAFNDRGEEVLEEVERAAEDFEEND